MLGIMLKLVIDLEYPDRESNADEYDRVLARLHEHHTPVSY